MRDAKLISLIEVDRAGLASMVYSAEEAAERLGVSVSTVRADCRRLGVQRISGRVAAGFVQWSARPVDIRLAVARLSGE